MVAVLSDLNWCRRTIESALSGEVGGDLEVDRLRALSGGDHATLISVARGEVFRFDLWSAPSVAVLQAHQDEPDREAPVSVFEGEGAAELVVSQLMHEGGRDAPVSPLSEFGSFKSFLAAAVGAPDIHGLAILPDPAGDRPGLLVLFGAETRWGAFAPGSPVSAHDISLTGLWAALRASLGTSEV